MNDGDLFFWIGVMVTVYITVAVAEGVWKLWKIIRERR